MRIVAFDTEARGLNWWNPNEQAFLATWADDSGEYCVDLSDESQVSAFRQAIEAADAVVGHNLKFDAHQVRETLGWDPLEGKIVHDTDLLSRVVYPEGQRKGERGGHGLKNLAKVFLRADAGDAGEAIAAMAKEIGLRTIKQAGAYYEVWRAYPDVMEQYALMDARFTYDLYAKFAPAVKDLKRIYDLEMAVMPILVRAEQRGVATDQEACAALKQQYTDQLTEVQAYLLTELGEQALGGEGSEDALIEALQKVGVPLHQRTDTGKLATNKFALAEFENDYPQIAALQEYRTLERFITTYIGAIEGNDIVHASFNQCGAWTGRMSCRNPNMQNWPQRAGKEVRSVFVPRPGYSFIVADYDQIETRLLAYYLNDEAFRRLIDEGYDAHAWVAAQIWPEVGPYEYFVKGGPGEVGEKSRKTARHTEFAIVYGAGAKRITGMHGFMDPGPFWGEDHPTILAARAAGHEWPKPGYQYHEAKALIRKIKAALPGYNNLVRRVRKKIETVGYVNTIMGRKNPVSKDKAYVGVNALIQGSAADIMKQGLVNVDAVVRPFGGTPLLVVHDEVVIEIPTEYADEALPLVEQAMVSAYDLNPRLTVSGSVVHTHYGDA